MNWLTKRHKLKSVLLFLVAAVVIITTVHTVMYFSVKNIVEAQIGISAQTAAVSIAHNVMENIDAYKLFMKTRDINSAYYKKMQQYFAGIKVGSQIKFIYTERRMDADSIEFILDAEPIGTDDYSPPGSQGLNDWMRETVYTNKIPAKFAAVTYPVWGNLIVGYAPIFDKDGTLLGLVGTNIASDELFSRLNHLNIIMISLYVTLLSFIAAILMKSSSFFLEKLLNDKLTGAINKRYFEVIMKEEMVNAFREKTNLALFVLDLDHFKNVNDTYGHIFGDQVLASVAATIKKFLRQNDYFIRYGGEEFVMIMPRVAPDNALNVAERIRSAVENMEIFNKEKNIHIRQTISIGISSLHGDSCCVAQDLLHNADKALYDAKVMRNSVSVFKT